MGPDTTARGGGSRTLPYRSARRQGQARRTRQRTLDKATAEFSSRGYTATTVAAIAAAAAAAGTFLAAVSAGVVDAAERATCLVLVAFEAAAGDPRLRLFHRLRW